MGLYFAQMGDNYSALRRNPAGNQRHVRIILCLGSKISIFAFGLALEGRGGRSRGRRCGPKIGFGGAFLASRMETFFFRAQAGEFPGVPATKIRDLMSGFCGCLCQFTMLPRCGILVLSKGRPRRRPERVVRYRLVLWSYQRRDSVLETI